MDKNNEARELLEMMLSDLPEEEPAKAEIISDSEDKEENIGASYESHIKEREDEASEPYIKPEAEAEDKPCENNTPSYDAKEVKKAPEALADTAKIPLKKVSEAKPEEVKAATKKNPPHIEKTDCELHKSLDDNLKDTIFNQIYGSFVHSTRKAFDYYRSGGFGSVYTLSAYNESEIALKVSCEEDEWVENEVYKDLKGVSEEHYTVHIPEIPRGTAPFTVMQKGVKYRCLPMEKYDADWTKNLVNGMREAEAVRVTLSILYDLKFFHKAGWIHRDIKPQNIVKKGNSYIIIDWGAAVKTNVNTENIDKAYTAHYANPKRFLDGNDKISENDVRVDLYSVGIFLLRLLLSNEKFEGCFEEINGFSNLKKEKVREYIHNDAIYEIIEKAAEGRFENADYMYEAVNCLGGSIAVDTHGIITKKDIKTPWAFAVSFILAFIASFLMKGFAGGDVSDSVTAGAIFTAIIAGGLWFLLLKLYTKQPKKMGIVLLDRMNHPVWIICALSPVILFIPILLAKGNFDISHKHFITYFAHSLLMVAVFLFSYKAVFKICKSMLLKSFGALLFICFVPAMLYSFLTVSTFMYALHALAHFVICLVTGWILPIVFIIAILLCIGICIMPRACLKLFDKYYDQ